MATVRFTAKCQNALCKHFWIEEVDESKVARRGKQAFIIWPHPGCPKCFARGFGTPVFKNIKAEKTETECRGDCWAAKGDVCHCSCGGDNHGRAYMRVNLGASPA